MKKKTLSGAGPSAVKSLQVGKATKVTEAGAVGFIAAHSSYLTLLYPVRRLVSANES
jgi:hypothetical protein